MNYQELGRKIFEVAYLTGQFKLRSGKISNEYFDKYQFESQPELLDWIARFMVKLLPEDFDILAGLETGGIPIATAISLLIKKPVVFVRKKAKEYGTLKLAEGVDIKGKKIIVVEDVVTSGGQVIESIRNLRNQKAVIHSAICVIDREEGGIENLLREKVQLSPLYKMSYLKNLARNNSV